MHVPEFSNSSEMYFSTYSGFKQKLQFTLYVAAFAAFLPDPYIVKWKVKEHLLRLAQNNRDNINRLLVMKEEVVKRHKVYTSDSSGINQFMGVIN